MEPKLVFVAAVTLFTLLAAICDVRTKKVPKWLTVPAFLAALGFHAVVGGWAGLGQSLAGFAVGFGILFVLFLIGGGGAGDVKLMGALGAWLGASYTIYVFVVSTLIVIVGAVAVLVFQAARHGGGYVVKRYVRGPNPVSRGRSKLTEEAYLKWRQRRRIMPYGLPVALGTWLVLVWKWQSLVI